MPSGLLRTDVVPEHSRETIDFFKHDNLPEITAVDGQLERPLLGREDADLLGETSDVNLLWRAISSCLGSRHPGHQESLPSSVFCDKSGGIMNRVRIERSLQEQTVMVGNESPSPMTVQESAKQTAA